MIDVRGQGIAVLDLRLTLGLEPTGDTESTRIVVLRVSARGGEMTVGLRTDRVFEVTVLDTAALDPAPAVGGTWTGECIAGIGRRNGSFVTVIDLDRLLGGVDIAVPGSAQKAA